MLDAELRLNVVVDHDNGLRFVSTFRLAPGVGDWIGAVAHRADDLQRLATRVCIEELSSRKLRWVTCEMLRRDVTVSTRDGRA